MYAKMKHVHAGRTLYVVDAFPSSLPGKTQASITTVIVTDCPRIRWQRNLSCVNPTPRFLHVAASRRPTYAYMGRTKASWTNATFETEARRRFCSDDDIVIRENSCRRTFLKLKHAEAYKERILAERFNARELAYIKWNDETSSLIGCKDGIKFNFSHWGK